MTKGAPGSDQRTSAWSAAAADAPSRLRNQCAGGYVGDGVAASHMAGRTLGDLIIGRESQMTALPWVNHRSPKWEPEPFRWIGVPTPPAVLAGADKKEKRTGKPALRARLMKKVLPI